MKTTAFPSVLSRMLFLISLAVLVIGTTAMAQDNKAPSGKGKQKVTIHITREEDGKTIVTDTSFTVNDEFDVPAWIDEQDFAGFEPGDGHKKMKHKIIIPHGFSGPMHMNMDTIIMNGDTMLFGINEKDIRMMIPDLPELEGLELEKEIQDALRGIEMPEMPEIPGYCPHAGFHHPIPFHNFTIPGLEGLMPFGNLEEIEVKKSRNGKKVTIRFKDRENDQASGYHYHFNDAMPEHEKKVIIRKDINRYQDQETEIERKTDGDKEIIIIRKKGNPKK